jgi:hypothetical protein
MNQIRSANEVLMATQKTKNKNANDRGVAQREDALESYDKAMETQRHFTATSRIGQKEKQASMKQDHSKPKYRQR